MTEPARAKTRDEHLADVVNYENAMREGAESEKSAVLQSAIDQDMSAGIWDSEFRAFVDAQTLKQLYFSELWVFLTVDLVAMKISSQPCKVMTGKVENGKFIKKPAENHPLQTLLENPNPFQSYASWMYCMVVDLCLLGNGILWYASQANYLMLLPGETVMLDVDREGKLASYKVTEAQADGAGMSAVQTKFAVEDIIHLRRPNPSSLLWGLSPFIPGRKSILFNRYSQDYLNSFYQKGAMPGFALEMGAEANERVAMRLLRTFENAYTGRKNMRRTLVLPKGVSLKETAHSLADQDLSTYINMNREDIINILKVPKHELSLQESGSLGSEEAQTSLANFWQATLIPMIRIIEGELTRFFRRRGHLEGTDTFVEFDLSNVGALQDDMAGKADMATKMLASGWSVNEVRTKVWELPESSDPAATMPYLLKPAAAPGGFPTFALPQGMAQSLSLPAAAAPSASAEDDRDATATGTKAAKDKLTSFLKGGDGWWARREAHAREAIAKGVGELEKSVLKMFADMAVSITKAVKSHLKEKSWDTLRTKADERAKLIGKAELRRKLRRALDKFEERWIDDVRKALVARVEAGYGVAVELPFNLASESEIAGLRERGAASRLDALEERAGRAFAYMEEATVEGVYSTIEAGIDDGKTVQAIAKDLRDKFSDVEQIGSRAMMIARTETLTAVSLGQAAAMADAGRLVPDLMKMWISADDDRVRESHEALHGDVVAHDDEFANGLQFPRDPSGPPEEVINCFPASTRIDALGVERVFQRFYRGPLVTVQFKNGAKIAGTPNHPVLTPKGWIGLGALTEGDNVFKARCFDLLAARNKDIEHVQSTEIHEVFSTRSHTGVSMRTRGRRADFHGDGTAQDVDIVSTERSLKHGLHSGGHEGGVDLGLASTDFAHRSALGERTDFESPRRVTETHGGVSGGDLAMALLVAHAEPFQTFGGAAIARSDASRFQATDDASTRNAKSPADLGNADLLLDVELDNVVSVDVDPCFAGHVYNLQTGDGYYIADGVIVHNCRCTWIMVPKDQMQNIDDSLEAEEET